MSTFQHLVDQFVSSCGDVAYGQAMVEAMANRVEDSDIAYLATRLADSGEVLDFGATGLRTADIASTGGPSSLSTIMCQLYLQALGYVVPKLAIPGRPAGGIDVLAQVPQFNYVLDPSDVIRIITTSGYAHFIAGKDFAPLDAQFFSLRKRMNSIAVPGLVIASILSKKIAAGVMLVGLDVRTGKHGNFGTDLNKARANARRFCRVAKSLGRKAVCFLTNGDTPYQPFIGRGEALLAVSEFLDGGSSTWLNNHVALCQSMAARLAAADNTRTNPWPPSRRELLGFFQRNLEAQGSRFEYFAECARGIRGRHTYEVTARTSGFLYIDLPFLRKQMVACQQKAGPGFTDPCGLILQHKTGDWVEAGDLMATARLDQPTEGCLHRCLGVAFDVRDGLSPMPDLEEITDE